MSTPSAVLSEKRETSSHNSSADSKHFETTGVMAIEDLYREIILDHYRSPRNRGELQSPPAQRAEGFNPLCGDQVIVTVELQDGKVADIKFTGQGCSISQSSASMMSAAVKGKPVDEVKQLVDAFKEMMSIHERRLDEADDTPTAAQELGAALGDLEALQGVVKFPVRIKCATLSWNTLVQSIDGEAQDGPASS